MESYHFKDITELAKALLAVQSQLQPALKDAENPFTRSSYATLNSVMNTCRQALLANGILMTQFPCLPETGTWAWRPNLSMRNPAGHSSLSCRAFAQG